MPGPARPPRPHTLLVTGAGGAGRSTLAAAAASAAARRGHRTLLLSQEPADRLAALLGCAPPEHPGSPWEAAPGLWTLQVDAVRAFRTALLGLQERLRGALDHLGATPLDEDELLELPGAGEFALLRALTEASAATGEEPGGVAEPGGAAEGERGPARPGGWDTVVADLPPVRQTVPLLALPEVLPRYLRRLAPPERQAARALRPVLAQLAGVPVPGARLYETTAEWQRALAGVRRAVTGPHVRVRLVTEAGPLALRALGTARAALALHGLPVDSVAVNRLLPDGSADPWLAEAAGTQRRALRELRAECAADGVPLLELPHLGHDPCGPGDLAALDLPAVPPDSPASTPASAATAPGAAPQVEDRLDEDGELVWPLPVPGADKAELGLVRRGDELIVDVGPHRRVLELPSALRRCRVAGAALEEGELRVRFVPDPGLWPTPS
ncbi:ArsA family ATPase [Streptomyces sp. AJS327]|uniref:ArsA family ATPase n=1 Tax=Streptomyces sp. AJS327 TaxID=2545265 RepID=UPI0015DE6A98|nr:ArsA family ATPase [Streptomyces sp. AJS327]MBA0050293.1 ArsA family ATPase [Streptomyces sp. AJS327]